ncbi:MAG TPA: hypothetical protein VK509_24105 [Polyangiales bacterium]|nr:hypothetical protein [Polyangiales bacterium]
MTLDELSEADRAALRPWAVQLQRAIKDETHTTPNLALVSTIVDALIAVRRGGREAGRREGYAIAREVNSELPRRPVSDRPAARHLPPEPAPSQDITPVRPAQWKGPRGRR